MRLLVNSYHCGRGEVPESAISGGGVGEVPESHRVGRARTETESRLGAGVTLLDLMMLSTTLGFLPGKFQVRSLLAECHYALNLLFPMHQKTC